MKQTKGSSIPTEKGDEGTISEVAHCTTAANTERVSRIHGYIIYLYVVINIFSDYGLQLLIK